jgi:carbamoyltransferase
MEFGPRALGNRSILCDARDPKVNDRLNRRLRRTEFMPFAPATLAECADDYYRNCDGCRHAAQFMTLTLDCTQRMRRESPAVVHVDGTARPQFVTREANPGLHEVLREYRKRTGIGSIVNTSFNMHESPIVNTPEDAVVAFRESGLDYLAIGPFLMRRDHVPPPRRSEPRPKPARVLATAPS